tara:strand:- start:1870 stop:2304 length:435 start_codon:yes stop_codon:yes gene_type:complete
MKTIKTLPILFVLSIIVAQGTSLNENSILKYKNLLGVWAFESMTTIKKGKREEITIVYKDKKNIETLKFNDSGAINFNVINDGIEKKGIGTWFAEENYITIIVESDTTYGTYSIDEKTLILILNAEETEKTYSYSTILKYIKEN